MSLFERLRDAPRLILGPIPPRMYQPFLNCLLRNVIRRHPDIFDRLETGTGTPKTVLIDPTNFPVAFLLRPHSSAPSLRACRRGSLPVHDARISASFLTLLRMVDGQLDGDALFFTRDLRVEGDTEIVVRLRNALDDMDGSVADDIAGVFGVLGRSGLSALRAVSRGGVAA